MSVYAKITCRRRQPLNSSVSVHEGLEHSDSLVSRDGDDGPCWTTVLSYRRRACSHWPAVGQYTKRDDLARR